MTISASSPITGAAISGLTSPTYTVTSDQPPDALTKQWAVTALGGTQTGVNVHSTDLPFILFAKKPKQVKSVGARSITTGQFLQVPKNEWKMGTRKGVAVQSGQNDVMAFDASIRIPVGAASYSPAEVNAFVSSMLGWVAQQAQGIRDTLGTGIL